MPIVWAFREGKFASNATSGWSHTVKFGAIDDQQPMMGNRDTGTADLLDQLENANLRGIIDRLDIVAHGDPGKLLMSGRKSRETHPQQLRDLAVFLRSNAMLVFPSCRLGAGTTGDEYLKFLSHLLPGRVIVANDTWGWFAPVAPSYPGQVQEAPSAGNPGPGAPYFTPWSAHAKWAYRGSIVRLPTDEQKGFRNKRCANPSCPGHASENDRCPYSRWGTISDLLKYNP
jgi:hypothetical protein